MHTPTLKWLQIHQMCISLQNLQCMQTHNKIILTNPQGKIEAHYKFPDRDLTQPHMH